MTSGVPPVRETDHAAASLIGIGGVFLPGHLAEPIWRTLREDINRRQRDGGTVRPEIAQALDVLRLAALNHLSANGPHPRTSADIPPQSTTDRLMTTADLATRLRVTERHARRIAHAEGIKPVTRNLWDREDVAALAARRGV